MKTITNTRYAAFALFAFACSPLSPTAQAVVPAPDGNYPNYNTAEGQNALFNLTSGIWNTALGAQTLFKNNVGSSNTAVGLNALFFNTSGSYNTATGAEALQNNIGSDNTANGYQALFSNTTGALNSAVGYEAFLHNTTGNDNTATGAQALFNNTTGGSNTASGYGALPGNTTGSQNTASGFLTLYANTTGSSNTAIGWEALPNNTIGSVNTAIGLNAGANVVTATYVTCLGAEVAGADVSNTTWIGNVYGVTTQSGTTASVIVSADGQLGTVASSERFKKDIAAMEEASDGILSLRPVTFHYKTDTKGTPQFGLIAEEVAKVNPALVLPDKEGKPFTVRYDAVNAMLLNEFLKEHRKVEQQRKNFEAALAQQQKQIDALTAGLQKVSAQLELRKAAPQTAVNNH